MELIDWAVMSLTLIFIIVYGIWKNNSHKNIQDYIRGGNQASWFTVGLSVMATQASAITFLSTPGQAFNDGMGFVQFYFGLPFAMIIICLFFLPVYHRLKVFTAYEFLEKRFDLKTRTLTAALFLVQRGLAAGITIYAPAIILSVVLGWNLKLLVVVIGLLVVFYTLIGGTQAVNVTQKQQMFIIFSGMVAAFIFIVRALPENLTFSNALHLAGINDKLNLIDFNLDFNNRYNFWSGVTGGLFLALSYFGTDQSQVQRYLSGRSLAESQRGLIMNGFLKIPMQFFILLTGVLVFVFFQFEKAPLHFNPYALEKIKTTQGSEQFEALEVANDIIHQEKQKQLQKEDFFSNTTSQKKYLQLENQAQINRVEAKKIMEVNQPQIESNDKDYVFIYFILNYLPQGLIGLLLAVILSAAMSSSASEINALSATSVVDLYQRFSNGHDEKHYVWAGRGFTLLWGIIAIAFALVGNLFENLIQLVNIIGSLFYGTILGIFLIAIFLKSIRANAVFYAAILTEIIVLIIYSQEWVTFLWLNVIGAVLTIITALIIQPIVKK
ncbi:MAG: sodium:solute symporter [Flavobacteriaceae bacterium]|jgi:SSS family transporter|nr:sodium:solute symporter [Flavobacteriaceae bacterium]MBT6127658.1 sodium:solute symporter [Flavobacteriaceae bacterium]MDG1027448.1 sodium:solute symporter [Flavobacteriaceae bacterium]